MKYAKLTTPTRTAHVAFEPTNFSKPYKDLHNQTDVSGFELFVLDSHNNYDNPFHQARENLYKQRGNKWFGLITRDIVREGRGADDKSRLNVQYVSHAGTQWEKVHNVWMPKNGFYVPNDDGLFHEGTLVPIETVEDRNEAIRRLKKSGMSGKMVSYFYRLDDYKDERFVGVGFGPVLVDYGRFFVYADRLPSGSGGEAVGSLPAYREHEIAMEITSTPKVIIS